MPAAKSERVAERKRLRNLPLRSRVRTYVRSARRHIDRGELDGAEESVRRAIVALDKAAARGTLHPNNAARRKSRLMTRLNNAKSG